MAWVPANEKHAIQRVRVSMELASHLSQKTMRKMSELADRERTTLGLDAKSEAVVEQVAIVQGPAGPGVQTQRLPGWQLVKFDSGSLPSETLSVNPVNLTYETDKYASWEDFSTRFEFVSAPFLVLLLDSADVSTLSIEYYDKFLFHGFIGEAKARQLLSDAVSSCLTDSALDFAEPFHLHRGWFSQHSGLRLLVNQNIDALDEQMPHGDSLRAVNILTKVDQRLPSDDHLSNLPATLAEMHDVANETFKAMLADDIAEKIGL